MPVGTPPALYRIARLFRVLSILALVLVFVYVGVAVYSASRLRGTGSNGGGNTTGSNGGGTTTVGANDAVTYATTVNLTNPGFLPINALQVSAIVSMPGGPVLARGGSPAVAIGPGQTAAIPITFSLPPLTATGPAALLVTHDANLPMVFWINVTFASIFGLSINTSQNYSWGAPFDALNATVGSPMPQSNGTVEAPVTLSFQDHAKFADVGTVTATLESSGGSICSTIAFSLNVANGGSYSQTQNAFVSPGCNLSGGSVQLSYTAPNVSVRLPAEPIP